MPVHPHRVGGRDRLDELDLVVLAERLVVADRAVAVPDLGADRVAGGDDLAHPGLDGLEVLGGEGLGAVEIVVPAVLDHRADGDLHVRPELLHGARHDVGGVVADEFEGGGVLRGDHGEAGVRLDGAGQVGEAAVDLDGERGLAEGLRDVGGDLGAGDAGSNSGARRRRGG